jgi:hypothetical protein
MIEVSDKNRKVVQESARWETIISKTGRIYEGLSG